MGFWNIRAWELRVGDEIRVRTMGGEEFLAVTDVESNGEEVRTTLEWGSHVPTAEPFIDTLPPDQPLTVRR